MNTFKVVFVGDPNCGKSSILLRLTKDEFKDQPSTIGVSFVSKNYDLRNSDIILHDRKFDKIKVHFWDTAGNERYRSLLPMYYRDADVIIYTADINNQKSIDNLIDYWIPTILEHCNNENVINFVLLNKADKLTPENYNYNYNYNQVFKTLLSNVNIFIISAKNGNGISDFLSDLMEQLNNTYSINDKSDNKLIILEKEKSKIRSCCF